MTIMEMLNQSGVLTLLGMGVVFSFLVILVLCVSGMGKIFRILGTDKDINASPIGDPSSRGDGSVQNPAIVAAITGAVNDYRKNNL